MKRFLLLIGLIISQTILAQKSKTYNSLEEALKQPNQVYKLNLEDQKLTKIPDEIGKLINLRELNLSNNKLYYLPESIRNLTKLRSLIISYNNISNLPKGIIKLKKLTTLHSEFNQFKTLSEYIGYLPKLTSCDFSANDIQSLPSNIGDLNKLASLYLWGNKLNRLPQSIYKLNTSIELYLDGDLLTTEEKSRLKKTFPNCRLEFDDNSNKINEENNNVIGFICGGTGSSTLIVNKFYNYINEKKFNSVKKYIYSNIIAEKFLAIVFSEILNKEGLIKLNTRDLKRISKIYQSKKTFEYCGGCTTNTSFSIKACLLRQDSEKIRTEAEVWLKRIIEIN